MTRMVQIERDMLDILAEGDQPPEVESAIMEKLGVDEIAVDAWAASYDPSIPDYQALEVRNKVFDNIMAAKPLSDPDLFSVESGLRFIAKNLIDQDKDTQVRFWEKMGYGAGVDQKDNVYIDDKKTGKRFIVDPDRLDLWDITDVLTDVAEGILGGAATASAFLFGAAAGGVTAGPVGAAAGGLTAGAAASAAVPAAAETAKQTIARMLGIRDSIDIDEVVNKAQMGVLFAPIDILTAKWASRANKKSVEKAIKKATEERAAIEAAEAAARESGGRLLPRIPGERYTETGLRFVRKGEAYAEKEGADKIREAAEVLGIEVTPGMVKKSEVVQRLESSIMQDFGKMGGKNLRRKLIHQREQIQHILGSFFEDALPVQGRSAMDQGGELFKKRISETISERLAPADLLYNEIDARYGGYKLAKFIKEEVIPKEPDSALLSALTGQKLPLIPKKGVRVKKAEKGWLPQQVDGEMIYLRDELKMNPQATGYVNQVGKLLEQAKTIKHIDGVRRFIQFQKRNNPTDDGWRFIDKVLAGKLGEIKTDAVIKAADSTNEGAAIRSMQEKADKIWREVAQDINQLMNKAPNSALKPGVKQALLDYIEPSKISDIKIVDKILDFGDPKRVADIAKKFPEEFEILRRAKLTELAEKFSSRMESADYNASAALKYFASLTPKMQTLMFGEGADKYIKAIKTVLQANPRMFNPSETATKLSFDSLFNFKKAPIEELNSVMKMRVLDYITQNPGDSAAVKHVFESMEPGAKAPILGLMPATIQQRAKERALLSSPRIIGTTILAPQADRQTLLPNQYSRGIAPAQ